MSLFDGQETKFPLHHNRLRKLIRQSAIKYEALAAEIGVTSMTINRWTRGKTDKIKSEHLKELARSLNVEPETLVLSESLQSSATDREGEGRLFKVGQLLYDTESVHKLLLGREYDLLIHLLQIPLGQGISYEVSQSLSYYVGVCYYRKKEYKMAAGWFKRIIRPNVKKYSQLELRALQLQAMIAKCEQRYEAAFDRLIRLESEVREKANGELNLMYYTNIGQVLREKNKFKLSLFYLEKALPYAEQTSRPHNAACLYRALAEAFLKLGCFDDARKFARKAHKLAFSLNHSYGIYRYHTFRLHYALVIGYFQKAERIRSDIRKKYAPYLDEHFRLSS